MEQLNQGTIEFNNNLKAEDHYEEGMVEEP